MPRKWRTAPSGPRPGGWRDTSRSCGHEGIGAKQADLFGDNEEVEAGSVGSSRRNGGGGGRTCVHRRGAIAGYQSPKVIFILDPSALTAFLLDCPARLARTGMIEEGGMNSSVGKRWKQETELVR